MNFHAKNLDFDPKSNLQNLEKVNFDFDHFLDKNSKLTIFFCHFKLIVFGQIGLKKLGKRTPSKMIPEGKI